MLPGNKCFVIGAVLSRLEAFDPGQGEKMGTALKEKLGRKGLRLPGVGLRLQAHVFFL